MSLKLAHAWPSPLLATSTSCHTSHQAHCPHSAAQLDHLPRAACLYVHEPLCCKVSHQGLRKGTVAVLAANFVLYFLSSCGIAIVGKIVLGGLPV